MRTLIIILGTLVAVVMVAALWVQWPWPLLQAAPPELGVVAAAYLGVSAKRELTRAVLAAVVLGYLADAALGMPRGLYAVIWGVTTMAWYWFRQRLLVRGFAMTASLAGVLALWSAACGELLLWLFNYPRPAPGALVVVLSGLMTAVPGALLWRGLQRIDVAFARTARERQNAMEGLF